MNTYQNDLNPNESKHTLSVRKRTKQSNTLNLSEQILDEPYTAKINEHAEVPQEKQTSEFILIDYLNSMLSLLPSAIFKSNSFFAGQKFALILKSFYFFVNFFYYYYFLSFAINSYIQHFVIAAVGLFCLFLFLIDSKYIKLSFSGKIFVNALEGCFVSFINLSFMVYCYRIHFTFLAKMQADELSQLFILLHEISFKCLMCAYAALCYKFKNNKKIMLFIANAIAFIYILSLFGFFHVKTYSILTVFHIVLLMIKFYFVSAFTLYNDCNSFIEFFIRKLSIFLCCVFMFMAFNWRIFSVLESINGCYSKDIII